jgi:hypothetical protein
LGCKQKKSLGDNISDTTGPPQKWFFAVFGGETKVGSPELLMILRIEASGFMETMEPVPLHVKNVLAAKNLCTRVVSVSSAATFYLLADLLPLCCILGDIHSLFFRR